MLLRSLLCICILALASCASKTATPKADAHQETLFSLGPIAEIESDILKESRSLNIYLPQDYEVNGSQDYPVIYLLDGSADEHFPHIAGLVQYLAKYQLISPSIVVGIANTDRYRDFTHPSSVDSDKESLPSSGGSEAFINFIEKELQPYINTKFHTNSRNTIIGQSEGGLLATEILLSRPQLFEDYILVDPSLWWDNSSLVERAAGILGKQPELKKKIYLASSGENSGNLAASKALVDAVNSTGNEFLKIYMKTMEEENGAVIFHKAVYDALEQLNPRYIK